MFEPLPYRISIIEIAPELIKDKFIDLCETILDIPHVIYIREFYPNQMGYDNKNYVIMYYFDREDEDITSSKVNELLKQWGL